MTIADPTAGCNRFALRRNLPVPLGSESARYIISPLAFAGVDSPCSRSLAMMSLFRCCAVAAALAISLPVASAQDLVKPGPEHEVFTKLAGDWTLTMKAGGMDSKGTVTYKSELGGLILTGSLEGEMFGSKFTGKSLDSYDGAKKKYSSIWVDSMSGVPMSMEGTYDKEKKTLTLAGEGPGMDGKPTKYKSVTVIKDADTIDFSMFTGDGKEPAFTIVYKRKK